MKIFVLILMSIILISIMFGCIESPGVTEQSKFINGINPTFISNGINGGNVYLHILENGIECAVYVSNSGGGIDCNWK